MKNTIKLVIVLFAVIMLSIVACKGKSGSSASAPADASSSESVAATESTDLSSIKDWDSFIKSYEGFILNEYVPVLTKIKGGDAASAAQLLTLQPKFEEWAQQIQNFAATAGTPTAEQAKKLEELAEKLKAAVGE